MSEREIHCGECHQKVGTIRDALLRKDICYVCTTCRDKMRKQIRELTNLNNVYKAAIGPDSKKPQSGGFDDLFSDIFGGK